uniref:Seed lectin n=2 Tax=Cajanus cajan TaxID=3821 RepID=A0A151RHT4_CAJCA|nr:Seed lectin [Cajanus cajan]
MIFFFFVSLLITVKSGSVSFSFSKFGAGQESEIGYLGDARPLGGAIQLTRRDNGIFGIPILRQNSVGRALYIPPIRLWDKTTGKLADFETQFSFVVDTLASRIHADGFSFFILPFEDPRIPKNSSGGYLGLFSPETAFNSNKNQIVAVEFDSFGNEWDPKPVAVAPHIGIDVNSLESVKTTDWPINSVPRGLVGNAFISYDSKTKKLSVAVGYVTPAPVIVDLSQTIDLRDVLPEWVRIGFSAATGDNVETHDILSWSFTSRV